MQMKRLRVKRQMANESEASASKVGPESNNEKEVGALSETEVRPIHEKDVGEGPDAVVGGEIKDDAEKELVEETSASRVGVSLDKKRSREA